MRTGKLAGVGAAIGAATAVTALLLGTSTAAAADDSRPETAFALATSGLLPLGPITKVSSPDGQRVYDELLGLKSVPGAEQAGIEAGLLTAEAKAGYASSSVAHLKLAKLLSADLIKTTCEDGHGKLDIVNGSVLGHKLPESPITGQAIDLSPLAKVTLGEETRNDDDSITVTGVKVTVLPIPASKSDDELTDTDKAKLPVLGDLLGKDLTGAGTFGDLSKELGLPGLPSLGSGVLTVTVGSATCAANDGDTDASDNGGDKHHHDGDDSDEPDADSAPDAPSPDVVHADLPVTG